MAGLSCNIHEAQWVFLQETYTGQHSGAPHRSSDLRTQEKLTCDLRRSLIASSVLLINHRATSVVQNKRFLDWDESLVEAEAMEVCDVRVEVFPLSQIPVKIASRLYVCIPPQDNGLLLVWYVCCRSPVCVCKCWKRLVCEYVSEKAACLNTDSVCLRCLFSRRETVRSHDSQTHTCRESNRGYRPTAQITFWTKVTWQCFLPLMFQLCAKFIGPYWCLLF